MNPMWTSQQAEALTAVFGALNASGLRWLILRNYEGLPEANRSKDIDLAFARADFKKAEAVITNSIAACGYRRVCTQRYQYAWCSTYFYVDGDALSSIKIDLLDGFVWRGAQMMDFDHIFSERVAYRDFFVPSRADDAVMLWLKPLMTGGFVKGAYTPDILSAIADQPDLFRKKLLEKLGPKLGQCVWPMLLAGDLERTIPYRWRICRAGWLRAVARDPFATLTAAFEHVYSELVRRLRRNPASMLAVVGPDGVGKSTFIEVLRSELKRIMVKDSQAIPIHHFRPRLLPNIRSLLRGKQNEPSLEEFSSPHRAPPAGSPSSLVRLMYYWTDYVLGYWLHIRRKCLRGNLIVFDRYFYDFIVDPRRSRINLPISLRKGFLRLTPEPDLVFFLDGHPDTVYARKQELTRDEIGRQLEEYRSLAAAAPERFVILDSSRSPAELGRNAVAHLVQRCFAEILPGPRC